MKAIKVNSNRDEKTYKQLFVGYLVSGCKWAPFQVVGIFIFAKLTWKGEGSFPYASLLDHSLLWWLIAAGLVVTIVILNSLVGAFYTYTRVRQPSYIKKQEAYEKWKAEKDAAKKAKNSSL